MEDDGAGVEQARPLLMVIDRAGIAVKQVWFHYLTLGGQAGEIEVEACLHHCLDLPGPQRDLLAHVANELIDRQPPLRAPTPASCSTVSTPKAQNEHPFRRSCIAVPRNGARWTVDSGIKTAGVACHCALGPDRVQWNVVVEVSFLQFKQFARSGRSSFSEK
ncbi:hypothetical protein ACFYE2_17905, partial [Kocuria sp. CPCC 205300]|uniref:hypothetical protein n=1 Tax=Kocuria sabuli TaxID=3071448 RepID=UPI0036DF64CB